MPSLVSLLQPGDTVLVGTGAGEPRELIDDLISASKSVSGGVRVIQIMAGGRERLAEESGSGIRLQTPVPGKLSRKAIAERRADFLPMAMSELLGAILSDKLRIDGVLIQGRPNGHGDASPGLIADIAIPAWERARFRAIELNAGVPLIHSSSKLSTKSADLVIETNYSPGEMRDELPTEVALRIGAFVAECVPHGATVELGIGSALAGIPAALIQTRRNLALHTGLVGDSAMHMIEAGCVDRPIFDDAFAVGATAMGTADFYRWADGNPSIAITDSRIAHNIEHLSGQRTFVAINGALEVDLTGAVNSSVQRGRIISGIGGARDFAIAGARGGASIIAIPATARGGESNIVRKVEFETIPPSAVTHVVTEFGVAHLKGRSAYERARALIDIAAPDHRKQLLKELGI